MRLNELSSINKLYLTPGDIAKTLGISHESACVTCSRYTKAGLMLRIKRNYYVLPHIFSALTEEQAFAIANMLQTPSYISLTTALSFHGISTQIQRDFYESVALKRTREFAIKEKTFVFTKIDRRLYGGFIKKDGYFMATPEKAVLDALYLSSLGRYSLDISAIDRAKLNKSEIVRLAGKYPESVRARAGKLFN
ncbi:MAG: type IV toxin-antitoxin system AbiEi family antitoxin domain-containing protein [Candidatus Omnitrophota bacterium]